MMNDIEEDLRGRILRQLSRQGATESVACVWLGYLNGLLEWGVITPAIHLRLFQLLPPFGYKESSMQLGDEPLDDEHKKNIEEYMTLRKKEWKIPR